GWAKLEWSENFSNDAISAVPGNKYIDDYLTLCHKNIMIEKTRQDILSRNVKQVKEGVMSSTGPEAMRHVGLPISSDFLGAIVKELGTTKKGSNLADILGYDPKQMKAITMADFPKYKNARELF